MAVYNQYNTPGLAVRFWEKVDKSADCWTWTGTITGAGRYGAVRVDRKMKLAHRVAYELVRGGIPAGMELDHLCRNTRCVRPDHLEVVTHRENMRRGAGWAGQNARKTRCDRHGLPLVQGPRERLCRECRREDNRAYRRRRKVAA